VLVDYKTVDGKPVAHSDKELTELTSLARQAAGIDDARGDKIEVHSIPFAAEPEAPANAPVAEPGLPLIPIAIGAGGAVVVMFLLLVVMLKRGRKKRVGATRNLALPVPVAEFERAFEPAGELPAQPSGAPGLPAGRPVQERVVDAVRADVERAAGVLTAWLAEAPAKKQLAKGAKS
jgi:flagellar biosynthesis/type III secretory pathway M-ring protein FliF/YscJ